MNPHHIDTKKSFERWIAHMVAPDAKIGEAYQAYVWVFGLTAVDAFLRDFPQYNTQRALLWRKYGNEWLALRTDKWLAAKRSLATAV